MQQSGQSLTSQNSGFIINFSPQDEQTRYSTYSIRNKVSEPPVTPTTPSTPLPSVEHADIDPLSSEYYAFKVLPREFITRGASTVNDDDLDDADISEVGDSCKAVTDRAVKRISDQCAKVSEVGEGLVVEKDVVRYVSLKCTISVADSQRFRGSVLYWFTRTCGLCSQEIPMVVVSLP